jgi:hypothetical protein
VFDSLHIALLSVACFLSFPVLFGMSLVNFKDMPVLIGISLISCGFVVLLSDQSLGSYLSLFTLIFLGTVVSMGTRIGIVFILIAIIGLNSLFILFLLITKRVKLNILYLFSSISMGLILSVLLLSLINPLIRMNLLELIIDSYDVTSKYPADIEIKMAGVTVNSLNLPWWYVPIWLTVKLPILFLLTFLIAFTIFERDLFNNVNKLKIILLFPFLIQSLIIPLIIISIRPTMYDEIRQLLFIYPGLIIGTILIYFLLINQKSPLHLDLRTFLIILILLIPATNLISVVRWFPYSYAYINEIGKLTGGERSWDVDYWGVSAYEGVSKLESYNVDALVAAPTKGTSFFLGAKDLMELNLQVGEKYGFYKFYRFDNYGPDKDCLEVFVIVRAGFELGSGAICSLTK